MQHPSWMLVRLALETRVHHASADSDRLILLEQASATRYRRYLARIYGLEAPFDGALAMAPDVDRRIVAARARAKRLEVDLRELGLHDHEIARLPKCTPIRPFRTLAQALGWLYVVERNTLLHGLLHRHLLAAIPDVARRAGCYLSAYGETPGAYYRELGEYIDANAQAPGLPNEIVAAAHEAFRCQRQWFMPTTRELGGKPLAS